MTEDRCDLLCLDLPHAEAVRGGLPNVEQAAGPAQQFRALADPQRLRIAAALQAGGELCVCDMAWIVGTSQNLVSHHARVLRTAGMAASRKDGKLVMYRLTDIGQALLAMTGIASPTADPGASHPGVSAASSV